jgi:predicted secreted protein
MKILAASYKSRGLFSQAVEFWNTLIEDSASFHEEAYESLSVHFEHREKNLAKALQLTEQAIRQVCRENSRIRWMHRRDRLLRKIQKEPGRTPSAVSDSLC